MSCWFEISYQFPAEGAFLSQCSHLTKKNWILEWQETLLGPYVRILSGQKFAGTANHQNLPAQLSISTTTQRPFQREGAVSLV